MAEILRFLAEGRARAIAWHVVIAEPHAVARARGLRREYRNAGIDRPHRAVHGCQEIRPQRRCVIGDRSFCNVTESHAGIARRLRQLGHDVGGLVAGEDAAIDVGGGALRQCVFGMAAAHQRRHARRADPPDRTGVGDKRGDRGFIGGIGDERLHRGTNRRLLIRCRLRQRLARQRAEFGLEAIAADLFQRLGQLHDRIDRTRSRGMAAGIGDGQLEIGIGLLRPLPRPIFRLARFLVEHTAAAIDVDHEFGILQPLGDQRGGLHHRFLVTREFDDDRALRLIARTAQVDERGNRSGAVELHVARAAPEQIPVFDHRRERVALPIGGLRLDHVHMAGDDQRLQFRIAAAPRADQIGGVVHRHDLDIRVRKPARDERGFVECRDLRGLIARPADRTQRDRLLGEIERLIGRCVGCGVRGGGRLRQHRCGKSATQHHNAPKASHRSLHPSRSPCVTAGRARGNRSPTPNPA